jgi:hypothetical protein
MGDTRDDTDSQIEHATAITFLYRELVLGTTELPTYADSFGFTFWADAVTNADGYGNTASG